MRKRRPYKPVLVDKRVKHGRTKSITYTSWYNMNTRCNNPKATQYKWYGGLGVKVCERWRDFGNFLSDVGERPSKAHTLDRYPDKNGNYEPGNVRWATQSEQCRNKKNNRSIRRSDGVIFSSCSDAAESVGGSHKEVWAVCNGRGKTHKGFGWVYA